MSAPWEKPFRLNTLDENWGVAPSYPGVYIISLNRKIPRIGGIDKSGILYVGKSKSLKNRLWEFWNADHDASSYLWDNQRIAAKILGLKRVSLKQFENRLGDLKTRIARIPRSELASAEKALLYAYAMSYGELPPLNFSLPKRWEEKPDAKLLQWATIGLKI